MKERRKRILNGVLWQIDVKNHESFHLLKKGLMVFLLTVSRLSTPISCRVRPLDLRPNASRPPVDHKNQLIPHIRDGIVEIVLDPVEYQAD